MRRGYAFLSSTVTRIFTRDMPLNDQPRHRPNYDFTREDYPRHAGPAWRSVWRDRRREPMVGLQRLHHRVGAGNPRLRGTVIVKPSVERYILEWMKKDGIVGVRLPFIGLASPPDLTSFEYRRGC